MICCIHLSQCFIIITIIIINSIISIILLICATTIISRRSLNLLSIIYLMIYRLPIYHLCHDLSYLSSISNYQEP